MSESLAWERDRRDWPHAACSRFVQAGGLRWHVQEFGEGEPMLLDGVRSAGSKERIGEVLAKAGFTTEGPGVRLKGSGMVVNDVATDAQGGRWVIELGGPFLRYRGGLTSVDAVWRTLHVLAGFAPGSGVCFDYRIPSEMLDPVERAVSELISAKAAAAGWGASSWAVGRRFSTLPPPAVRPGRSRARRRRCTGAP